MKKWTPIIALLALIYIISTNWYYRPLIEFIFAISLLIFASEIFTENAEKVGKALKLSSFITGVLILSVGTGMPEIASSIVAVLKNKGEIAFANAVGSNIASILLVAGISFLFIKKEYIPKWDLLHGDISFLLSALLTTGIVILDGKITFIESLLLLSGYVIYILYMKDANKWIDTQEKHEKQETLTLTHILTIIISIVIIAYGAELVVESLEGIAEIFNIPISLISLFAFSIGTSLPEFLISISAARKGQIDLALGNINGSNIFNIFLILGISGLFGTINIPLNQFIIPYLFLSGATISFILIFLDKKIHKYEGLLLILLYIFFFVTMISAPDFHH